MKKAFRVLAFTALALGTAAVIVAAAFWFTVPVVSEPPADFDAAVPTDAAVTRPALRAELLRMYWSDQAVRDSATVSDMSDLQSVGGLWRLAQAGVRTGRVDRPNAERVREIVATDGWPTADEVGPDGLKALFMIVQHATFDRDLQRAALDPLRDAYQGGHVSGQQLAMNVDRVRLADGQGQLYGTQVGAVMGEGASLAPVEDEANVDARRAALGLPPLAEYLAGMCAETGICVER